MLVPGKNELILKDKNRDFEFYKKNRKKGFIVDD